MRFDNSEGSTTSGGEDTSLSSACAGADSGEIPGTVTRQASSESRIPAVFVSAREALVDDSIERAKVGGYTVYTTTLRAAWEAAIDSINDALQTYVRVASQHESRILADWDYRHDKRFKSLREVAQFHRAVGVTLQMYIGLFKMFRDLYADHFRWLTEADSSDTATAMPDSSLEADHHLLTLFFDEAEISMMASWSETSDSVRKQELQQKALSASLEKDKYLAIFESLRDPAFLLDHDRELVNANQMANTLFRANASPGDIYYNRQQQHLTLQHVVELACKAARQQTDTELPANSDYGSLGAVDHLWLETLQGKRCFDIRERNIQDACENKAIGYVVILHDVTSHRQATEQAVKAEQEKSTFLATMSHEVRTPMHAILGATELLRHADRNRRDEYIDTIEATGQHLLETLTKVLDYSRLESGKQPINNTRNHLPAFIDKLELFARTWAHQAKRELAVLRQPDLPVHAVFDTGCTRQILHNLIANSVAHGEGLITLRIGLKRSGYSSEDSLIFDVCDQGQVLSNADLNRLFEPFYRGNSEINGTGLGLPICRHLAESMGGDIDARTCVSAGTTRFRLRIPLITSSGSAKEADHSAPPFEQTHRDGCVMLVDDDPVSARITADQLQLLGIQVDRFHTAGECLHALQQVEVEHDCAWQYFVVDYQLPDMNGAVLARRIRSMLGSNAARIMALTANTQLAQGDDGKAFDLILTKPAAAQDLVQALFSEHLQHANTASRAPTHHPFRGLPASSVQTIVNTFLHNWSEKLPGFFADLEAMNKPESVQQQAHHLASSASSVGLTELTEDLRQLDNDLLRQPDRVSGRYWLDRLEAPMRRAPIKIKETAESLITDSAQGA